MSSTDQPHVHHLWHSVKDFVNRSLSVLTLAAFLHLSISHGCSQVLQWWSREWESLTEGGRAVPPAVNHHRAVLQCGTDRWASVCKEDAEVLGSKAAGKIIYKLSLCCWLKTHIVYILPIYLSCCAVIVSPCCRLWESQCWAEGGSPLVVSPSAADRAAVWDTKAHRGKGWETGGDWTQVHWNL